MGGHAGVSTTPDYTVWRTEVNSQLDAAKLLSPEQGFSGHGGAFTVEVTGIKDLAVIISSHQAVGKAFEDWVEIDAKLVWTDNLKQQTKWPIERGKVRTNH